MRLAAAALALAALATLPSAARVDVTLDQGTLNDLITNLAPAKVAVPLPAGTKVNLHLDNVRVTGFEPAGASGSRGHILAALNLRVPELGLDVPVTPRLSLQFREGDGKKVAYLKFEDVNVPLAVTGNLNVAPLLPVLPLIADTVWTVDSARGPVRVEPKLVDAVVGTKNLRLGFDLDVAPGAKGKP